MSFQIRGLSSAAEWISSIHIRHTHRQASRYLRRSCRHRYRVRLGILVVQHTFGGRLNHNPHLHIMTSAGGLDTELSRWVQSINFDRAELMTLWRFAVTSYLEKAHRSGLLDPESFPTEFRDAIRRQTRRVWNIHVTPVMSKQHFLGYAGRYIRRPPISQRRILNVSERHPHQDDARNSLDSGRFHGSDRGTRPGSVPAFDALLRPAVATNEGGKLRSRLPIAWSA